MRLRYPGLMAERLPSGTLRYRVRPAGQKARKITLRVGPEHPAFGEHYHAARAGVQLAPEPERQAIRGSVGWLVDEYTAAMDAMRAAGQLTGATVHQRKMFLGWLRSEVGEYSARMPQGELLKLRDKKAATPGAADNFVKAARAMFAWAVARGLAQTNPAAGIARICRGQGAVPWTLSDLTKFRDRHPAGTMPHLALTLFMFTACRISDVVILGRRHEAERGGVVWLDWQPAKRGTARVRIPMLPPLYRATRAAGVIGPTYLLTAHGRPFASPAAFGNKFRDWCAQAGLEGRSPHGIRKAAGELLALHGASQYHIMAVHGHTEAKTSEVYTRGVERDRLAAQALQLLDGMAW
jgi:integrase